VPPPTQIAELAAATRPNTKLSAKRRWSSRRKLLGAIGLLVFLFVCVLLFHRSGPSSGSNSVRPIAVAKVTREDLKQTLTISAEFRPYQEVSLHAKVAGYVQWISVDVGDRVKEGEVLAKLDVPELKNDLQRDTSALQASREEVTRVQANYDQTHLASARLETVARQHPKLVAQQEVDDAEAKDQNAAGALAAAKQHVDEATAELNKTQALFNYSDITAPFDAVVTHRYADPGALIQAGTSSSQTLPVVDIEEESRLRLVFPVPESAVAQIRVGQKVRVSVSALQKTFDASISRFSDKVDRETRTMRTEADIDNQDGRFKPGMYADATIVVQERDNAVSVPVEAVSMAGDAAVLVVNHNGIVQSRPVTVGLTTANRCEILKGLLPGDLIVIGSRAGVRDGDKVSPKIVATGTGTE
jgi:RND family efflux transporter MFP subunit